MLNGKTILVTGGTGSFGMTFVDFVIKHFNPERIIVFSRDEKKQYDMRNTFSNPKLSFIIGDVRNRDTVYSVMSGVDIVFHAAALKQVPSCEFFPMEAVRTNILGSANVLDAAERHNVEKVVVLTTDKAVYPINAMGISKALLEKLFIAKTKMTKSQTIFSGVRYGNVLYSRGSVIPLFVGLIKTGKSLTITNPFMTRFLLPLSDAIQLVMVALENASGGEIFVKKSPAATIMDVARACLAVFDARNPIVSIGIRDGEKMHETLVTQEELIRATDLGDYYKIPCDRDLDYDDYFVKGRNESFPREGYTSENTARLNVPETKELLLSLPEIKREFSL